MTTNERFSSAVITSVGARSLPRLQLPAEAFPDGTMPVASLGAPIVIKVPGNPVDFQEEYEIQLVELFPDRTTRPIGPPHTVTFAEAQDPAFIFELTMPVSEYPAVGKSKTITLDYQVYDPLGTGSALSNLPVDITLDKEAPGGEAIEDMPIFEFTEDQKSGITLADVVGDHIAVPLPAWYGEQLGDVVTLWIGTSDVPSVGKYLTTTYVVTVPGGNGVMAEFLVSDLEAMGNGKLYFGYNLTDKAGNISVRSPVVGIDVLLTGAPGDFLAPTVPDFLDHGVVTQKDAAELVEVEIPHVTNAAEGDRIYVIWGTTRMPPYTLTAADVLDPSADPLVTIKLPYADVLDEGSGTGKSVTYEVWRGTLFAGTSPASTVNVNLGSPGPDPDPDPTTPEHENLMPLTVKSSGGADDRIPPADFGDTRNATATIPRLGVDGKPIWLPGDRVQVFWGTTPVTPPTPITAANAGGDITITIPGTVITGAGVGDIPVTYKVTRDIPPPPNLAEALSPVKTVKVESTGLLPGDGLPLAVAIFPEDKGNQLINRLAPTSGLDGTPIRIPLAGVTNIKAGDKLTLRFVGRSGGVSIPDPTLPISRPEIPGTEVLEENHILTLEELTVGYYQRDLPYNPTLRAICKNGSSTDYSITNGSGTTNAKQLFIRFALDIPGNGGVCSIDGN